MTTDPHAMSNKELARVLVCHTEAKSEHGYNKTEAIVAAVAIALDSKSAVILALRETVRVLGEECKAANEDVESCCDALDHLSSHATIGPAILANLDEAGRNEIEARREYARKVLRNTHNWKKAEAQMIADELADPGARAAVEGAQ